MAYNRLYSSFVGLFTTLVKNNADQVLSHLEKLAEECEGKRAEQENLVRIAGDLVETARLELAISVRVTEITARFQNLLGVVKVRTASAKNAASILSELSDSVDQFDIWLTDSTERFEASIGLEVDQSAISERLANSMSVINELMTECEYRRGTLVSLAERCARTTANVAHAPLSQKARESIHSQSVRVFYLNVCFKLQLEPVNCIAANCGNCRVKTVARLCFI